MIMVIVLPLNETGSSACDADAHRTSNSNAIVDRLIIEVAPLHLIGVHLQRSIRDFYLILLTA
jgi:hypothetical protein